jgi:hypothetical protein
MACESVVSVVPVVAHSVSTQWSTARTPVLSQMDGGVVVARSGSRMMSWGPRVGAWKECFRRVVSSVAPAKLEYSPAEREVGMEMMGMVGG